MNTARYTVFCSPNKVSEINLPPTKDELSLHIRRANYQTAIWRASLESQMDIPSPTEHGWFETEGLLKVKWMSKNPAPQEVLKVMFCKCTTGCKTQQCSCHQAQMKCTDLCKCQQNADIQCHNANQKPSEDSSSESDTDGKYIVICIS